MKTISSRIFRLYAKPAYKSGWRNYQVDLTKPVFESPAIDYGINYQYEHLSSSLGLRKSFLTGCELYFTVPLDLNSTEWVRKNQGKDFIIYGENNLIANGLRMEGEVESNFPTAKIRMIFQTYPETKRVFYIPKYKQVLLPHESIKHLCQ